jgi:6-phosphofructokinase 1
MRAFVSHGSGKEESQFALELSRFLRRCFEGGVFYFEDYQYGAVDNFVATINRELSQCQVFILLVGKKLAAATKEADSYQILELTTFQDYMKDNSGRQVLWMPFPAYEVPDVLRHTKTYVRIDYHQDPRVIAHDIVVNKLHRVWRAEDDLPFNSHLFSLENDIAAFFQTTQRLGDRLYEEPGSNGRHQQLRDKILNGCPSEWPKVDHNDGPMTGNPADQDIVGQFRPNDSRVIVSARHIDGGSKLTFLEAGPRAQLRFCGRIKGGATDQLNVALLVSGGIAPGTNAVIDGIVQRHEWYARDSQYTLNIFGVQNGFGGLLNFDHVQLLGDATSHHASRGGSILPTSRFPGLEGEDRQRDLRRMAVQLRARRIDILYVIGGDGSMRAAHALRSTLASQHTEIPIDHEVMSVVGVPKTMDNDVLWVWQSFGFLSAVEKAREILEHLSNEVTSNPRICVVQLFGSDSGFVVSHGVLATSVGVCDAALIPEVPFCTHGLTEHLVRAVFRREQRKARERSVAASSSNIPSSMVVMAETAIPVDALDYENDITVGLTSDEKNALDQFDADRKAGRRIEGRTPDDLRNAGLKIVKAAIQMHIPSSISKVQKELEKEKHSLPIINWAALPRKTLSSEPRHLLRAIPPNTLDLITAQRLGLLAVDNALAGYTDFMISQWLTEYVLVPLELVALGRKRIPENGMFWKSVVGKTGQPARMVCDDCRSKIHPALQPSQDSAVSAVVRTSNGDERAAVLIAAGAPVANRKQRRRRLDA